MLEIKNLEGALSAEGNTQAMLLLWAASPDKLKILIAELARLRAEEAKIAEMQDLLVIMKSWIGETRIHCSHDGKELWDRISSVQAARQT